MRRLAEPLQAAQLRIEDLHELVDAREAFIAEDGDKGRGGGACGQGADDAGA